MSFIQTLKTVAAKIAWPLRRVPVVGTFLASSAILFLYVQSNFEYYSYNPFFTHLLDLDLATLFEIIDPFDFAMRLVLNLLILFALHALLYALTGRSLAAVALTSVLVLILHQANHTKFMHLRDAISVQNLLYLHQLPEVIKNGYLPELRFVFAMLAALTVLPAWLLLQKRFEKLSRRRRWTWGIVSVGMLGVFFVPGINVTAAQLFRLETNYYSAALSMKDNGFFAALATDVTRTVNRPKVPRPAAYSLDEVVRILSPYSGAYTVGTGEPVRIIIYLMESFWDPARFPELKLQADPLREFRIIQSQSAYAGEMYSPTFGGFTVQAEFETITGMSARLIENTAYRTIERPAFSLASYMKMIRPTTNLFVTAHNVWFWDRSRILPRLGFDVLKEQTDFECRDYKGAWNCPSERCLIQESLRFMKSEIPPGHSSVILVNGVQNHGPYDKADDGRTFMVNGNLTEEDRIRLQNNMNHLADLSEALRRLIDSQKKVRERVIVLAFGDHLPGGYDFMSQHDEDRLHSTPFLIWSNRQAPKRRIAKIGANYLPLLALELSGMETLPVHRFLKRASHSVPVITTELASRTREEIMREETGSQRFSDAATKTLRDYSIIQYDLLYGEQFAAEIR